MLSGFSVYERPWITVEGIVYLFGAWLLNAHYVTIGLRILFNEFSIKYVQISNMHILLAQICPSIDCLPLKDCSQIKTN